MINGKFTTLAIETSCDETAAAVLLEGRGVLSNVISSQIDIHRVYGGVVPEIASRHHLEQINFVVEQALSEAGAGFDDIDLIGVTKGPGLVGALLIGISTAKGLSLALGKPIVGVHHIRAHICANYIEYPELEPPFLALVVSGGHTNIIHVRAYSDYEVLGATRDDAAGEAFDKVARVLGLEYPGGPAIEREAVSGNPASIPFKRVLLDKDSLDFSFSGTKTAVLNYINTERQMGRAVNVPDVAASFQQTVIDVITAKTLKAAELRGEKKIVMAGGVAANGRLGEAIRLACEGRGLTLYKPRPVLCTDNAAMVGAAAWYQFREKGADGMDLDAFPNLEI